MPSTDPVAAFRRFAFLLEGMRVEAFKADPTLEDRWLRARAIDSEVGWLDVAAHGSTWCGQTEPPAAAPEA